LADATERLVASFRADVPRERIVSAVVRATGYVRSGYAALCLDAPGPSEYVALVTGLAQQELSDLTGPISRRGRAIGIR